MTAAKFGLSICLAVLLAILTFGCVQEEEALPTPGDITDAVEVMRLANSGPIIVSYVSSPLREKAPPDGIRQAMRRVTRLRSCSAASFFWSERSLSERWLSEQMSARRSYGEQPRLIIMGAGLGGAEAAETAARLLKHEPDAAIDLLVTVDAIKSGKISSTAGVTGNVIMMGSPVASKKINFTSYDSAPAPDGARLLKHVNYYQTNNDLYRGVAMAYAENHLVSLSDNAISHANIDDYVYPYIYADLRAALGIARGR